MSLEYLRTSLVVILLSGTGMLLTMTAGLSVGFRASVAAALSCTLDIVAVASVLGLAAIFNTSAVAFLVTKYLGLAYLFCKGWMILRENNELKIDESKAPASHLHEAIKVRF
jgi:threonine/homoserine/homoserine lactone efflux protein